MGRRTLGWWIVTGAVGVAAYLVGRWLFEPLPEGGDDGEGAGPTYRGNEATHVFHAEDCRYFEAASSTRAFRTRAEAVGAGYEPCSLCTP